MTGLVLLAGLAFRSLFEEPNARRVRTLLPDPTCMTVLGVFAHPDDEILVAASLAEAVRRGCRVVTVTATHGLRGVPDGFTGDTASLARIRESELRRFGHEIGIREQEIWGFPDGGLSEVSTETLIDSVLSAFRRYQPDLVVTFDSAAGFTGHPDHRRIGEIAMLAWRRSCDAGGGRSGARSPRWIAEVLFPRRVAPLLRMRELRQRLLRQPPADVAVRGNLDMKLLGMSIHQTQQRYFPPPWIRPILYRFYDSEHFSLRSCPPTRAILAE